MSKNINMMSRNIQHREKFSLQGLGELLVSSESYVIAALNVLDIWTLSECLLHELCYLKHEDFRMDKLAERLVISELCRPFLDIV